MAVQAMYALKPTPCFLGGSFMSWGENGVFMFGTVKDQENMQQRRG